jgi:hypothetical protein
MKLTKEQFEAFLNGEIFTDLMTVAAFTIDKTPTEADNNFVASVGDYTELIAEKISQIEELNPDQGEALRAAIRNLQKVAAETEWKGDDLLVGFLARITGANKKK